MPRSTVVCMVKFTEDMYQKIEKEGLGGKDHEMVGKSHFLMYCPLNPRQQSHPESRMLRAGCDLGLDHLAQATSLIH